MGKNESPCLLGGGIFHLCWGVHGDQYSPSKASIGSIIRSILDVFSSLVHGVLDVL